MKNNLLMTELSLLQSEYRSLLSHSLEKWNDEDCSAVLDEIRVFWYKNRRLVRCVLQYASAPYHSFVYTGTTMLDPNSKDHYPFLCLGDFHIWDDPVFSYINMVLMYPIEDFSRQLKTQVRRTIEANLCVLNSLNELIYILPIRNDLQSNNQLVHETTLKFFLSLFKRDLTIEQYYSEFSTIDDIIPALKDDVPSLLVFDTDTDPQQPFRDRFLFYRNSANAAFQFDSSDAAIFWSCVYSHLAQALDIILACTEYKLIPYIGYSVCFHYALLLFCNFQDDPDIAEIAFRSLVANMLYRRFDMDRYSNIPLSVLYSTLKDASFEDHLIQRLKDAQVTINSPNFHIAQKIIDQEFTHHLTKLT